MPAVFKACNIRMKGCKGHYNLTTRTALQQKWPHHERKRYDACDNPACQRAGIYDDEPLKACAGK